MRVKRRNYFTVLISPMTFQVKFILTDRLFRNVRACSILSLHWNVLDPLSRGYKIQAKYITQKHKFYFKSQQKVSQYHFKSLPTVVLRALLAGPGGRAPF